MNKVETALEYARSKHMGQKRKDGSPYIEHPIAVAEYLMDNGITAEEYIITALFHDLLEDTSATEDDILRIGGEDVLEAVKLLTKREGVSGDAYIKGILGNDIAKAVKNADRIHNLREALTAAPDFVERYLKNTKEHYLGLFSEELDEAYEQLREYHENRYIYTLDTSCETLYRTEKATNKSWIFNPEMQKWIECDEYFWAELGDDAKEITPEEAKNFQISFLP